MDVFAHIQRPKKPRLCVWTDLNVHDMDQLLQCGSTSESGIVLKKIFDIDDSPRGQILLDLFLHTIAFSKLQKFSKEQSSAYFSIVKQTHEICTSTPFGNVEECFAFFRELVLIHSVHRPPWSLEIFNTEQIETITTHVINTYFRHYKLYKYAFTPKVKLDLSFEYEGLAPSPIPTPEEDVQDENVEAKIETVPQTPINENVEAPVPQDVKEEEEVVGHNEQHQELENLIRKAVGAQLQQMHTSVEQQLEDTDKAITEKIQSLELGGSGTPKSGKARSPKASPKGKRKSN
ncbi:unnamed protein product [Clavelina lepadiformis]|uniref:Coiled-coil domain-containing protein 189 n=1 Tax=Clavelina lepadiformis TaxID=159417 RepID=A0ABP0F821_CLALP